ncbi:MAG: serpin family protein, partial [Planctomycetota bacterium]|nr:serpin family protein [Planctomycetota bacterium]
NLAFDLLAADFSGITRQAKLSIALVAHKAVVDVTESGTEAAAATVVVKWERKEGGASIFNANRPFVFLIREKATGSILFMGRVTDPREK